MLLFESEFMGTSAIAALLIALRYLRLICALPLLPSCAWRLLGRFFRRNFGIDEVLLEERGLDFI